MIKLKRSKSKRRLAALQQYALTRAKAWNDPVMVKRFVLEADALKPLTDMQWWRLGVEKGELLIKSIRKIAESRKQFSGAGTAERVVPRTLPGLWDSVRGPWAGSI